MGGFQAEEFKLHYFDVTKYGLYVEDEDFWEFDLTSGLSGKGEEKTTGVNGYSREWATAGFFGRLNYDFMGRYLLEVNMRYDGTSRASAAAVAGNYPLLSRQVGILHKRSSSLRLPVLLIS